MELQKQKEEAILNRKRSSRIAIKESEKEEARRVAQRMAEDEERLARERRIEARAKKEEEEKLAREKAREQRRKEREEREENLRMKRERLAIINVLALSIILYPSVRTLRPMPSPTQIVEN